MDTVVEFESDRTIVWDGEMICGSVGFSETDDRAGITIILEALCRIGHNELFVKIKVAFTCAEEIDELVLKHIEPK